MPFLILIGIGVIAFLYFETDAVKTAVGYYRGTQIVVQLTAIGGGLFLERDAAKAFLSMQSAAEDDGVSLNPTGPRSAFRTPEDQASLVAEEPTLAAPVGHSDHQSGLCVDLETATGTNDAYDWLVSNASDYGFSNTVSREPWHWEYNSALHSSPPTDA